MPPLSQAALRKQIAEGALRAIYVVSGEDDAGKAGVVDDLIGSVDEGLQPFNVDRFDGSGATNVTAREALTSQMLAAAQTLPLMTSRRVVVLQRADALLFPRVRKEDENAETEKPVAPRRKKAAEPGDPIEAYIASPEPTTVLVFVVQGLPQNRRIGILLASQAVVTCGADIGPSEAARWIERQTLAAKVVMDSGAVDALVTRTGSSVVRLRAGLERVLLYAMGQPSVTAEDVREAVPAIPGEQENWGIANAVGHNDVAGALCQLSLALDAGVSPFMVLGQLRMAAEKLPASRVRAAIEAVFRTDLALKSSGGEPRVLVERLAVELCQTGRAGKPGGLGGSGTRPTRAGQALGRRPAARRDL